MHIRHCFDGGQSVLFGMALLRCSVHSYKDLNRIIDIRVYSNIYGITEALSRYGTQART